MDAMQRGAIIFTLTAAAPGLRVSMVVVFRRSER
jgi:hypothetical protein